MNNDICSCTVKRIAKPCGLHEKIKHKRKRKRFNKRVSRLASEVSKKIHDEMYSSFPGFTV